MAPSAGELRASNYLLKPLHPLVAGWRLGPANECVGVGHDAVVQMIDTSIVRVRQHGASTAGNAEKHMGRSQGGLTSKVHAVVDANGLPIHLGLTPGETHDNRLCPILPSGLRP